MARRLQVNKLSRRRAKTKVRTKKKDPIFVEGKRPKPMYVDYKGRRAAQEAHQPPGQDHQPAQERLHGRQPARGHQGHQARPLHGPAAVYGRVMKRRSDAGPPHWLAVASPPHARN